MFTLQRLPAEEFRDEESVLREMFAIVAPSYQDVSELFDKEISFCDTCYLGYSEKKLACFFLVRRHQQFQSQLRRRGVYLGLSAAAPSFKGSGAIRTLYKACLDDLQQDELEDCESAFLWGTTATPTVIVAANRHLQDMQPRIDGRYSESSANLVGLLKQEFHSWGWQRCSVAQHPFVLKGVSNARYSEAELSRIAKVSRSFTLFESLGVQESQGDRLIFVARHPRAKRSACSLSCTCESGGER
jgi:hypothetical protein